MYRTVRCAAVSRPAGPLDAWTMARADPQRSQPAIRFATIKDPRRAAGPSHRADHGKTGAVSGRCRRLGVAMPAARRAGLPALGAGGTPSHTRSQNRERSRPIGGRIRPHLVRAASAGAATFDSRTAEEVGFEPTVPRSGTPVFETGPFNHSGTPPEHTRSRLTSQQNSPWRIHHGGFAPNRGRRDAEETERQEKEWALVLGGGRSRAIPGKARQRVARRGDGEAVGRPRRKR